MNDDGQTRPASIRDVARAAGVSHQTVSRVLNDHPSIRPETRDRVRAAMADLSYSRNWAARALVTSRTRTIGILVAASRQYGPASAVAGIGEAARARGYWVSTATLESSDPASITAALSHLLAQSIEGLVVIAPQARVLRVLTEQAISVPYITLHSTDVQPAQVVVVDQSGGARLATRHLLERGHRMIYHLAGPQDWIEAESRMHGFLEEMRAWDAPTTAPILGDWTARSGYEIGRRLVRRELTAVFSANDQMALGLLHAIREAGLECPRDISIVGFDDTPEAAHFWPPLTTVR
ncbi:DNA-binding LacI/PurR family transcriptional regulator [Microbacterium dextranolyticum]|uniref:LacI family transcriptional regulator n=1 Tax=Microbacterium dextranolyticum TaxID=36806 RepID=A0A9W6HNZ7_9MICO|nr:DNA-binding LacI/PurR family transcriptional regulator [Microbacterium dextranolyticum]GLJ96697.1 LacI family transcriptional regulator [Microbacterium dextranolyticum]